MSLRAEYEQYIRGNINIFLRLAIQHCGDFEQAKDVVQLVIIKLWRLWQTEGPAAKRHAYRALYTVSIDEYRRRQRRCEVSIETDRTCFKDEPEAEPDVHEEVRDAVRELSPALHRVVFLKYYEGLSNTEMAAELDISNAQVSRDLHRAHAWLRKRLARKSDEE